MDDNTPNSAASLGPSAPQEGEGVVHGAQPSGGLTQSGPAPNPISEHVANQAASDQADVTPPSSAEPAQPASTASQATPSAPPATPPSQAVADSTSSAPATWSSSLGQMTPVVAPSAPIVQPSPSGAVSVQPKQAGASGARNAGPTPGQTARKAKVVAALTAAVVVLACIGGGVLALRAQADQKSKAANDISNYKVATVGLTDLSKAGILNADASSQLTINGQLRINNSFVLTPTATPTDPLIGQFYLNSGNAKLYYYNGAKFVDLATGDQITNLNGQLSSLNGKISSLGGQLPTAGTGLRQNGTKIDNAGVLSLQGQTGAVTLTAGGGIGLDGLTITNTGVTGLSGTANQISVSQSNGNVSLSLAQDIAPTSTPTFGGVKITDGSGNFSYLFSGVATTSNKTINIPTFTGSSADICLTSGNCAGAGSGVTAVGGSANHIALFTSGQQITNSILTQDNAATTLTVGGNLSVSGTASGNGSGLTNLNASNLSSGTLADARLSGNVSLLYATQSFTGVNTFSNAANSFTGNGAGLTALNASSISTGTLADARLSSNVALKDQSNIFTGANTFSSTSNSFTGNGAGLANLNGSNVASGTINDGRLSANVTLQGNAFNGSSQLVQTTAAGALPVLSGINLTNLNATNIASGTLSDARLSSNVALQNGANSFSGANTFSNTSNSFSGYGANLTGLNASNIATGTLNDARLSNNVTLQGNAFNGASQLVQLNSSVQLPAASGALLTNLNASSVSAGTLAVTYGGTGATTASGARSNLGAAVAGANSDITSLTALTAITPTSALTIGSTSQPLILQGSTTTLSTTAGGFAATLGFATPTANQTITLPNASGTICLSSGNCTGQGGPGANSSLSNLSNVAINTTLTPGTTGAVDLGSSSKAFRDLYLGDGSGLSYRFTGATADTNKTITIPTFAGATATLCLTSGNCAGAGGGVTSSGGTANTIALFNGSQQIGNSIVSQDSGATTVSIGGNLSVSGVASGNGSGLTNLNGSNITTGTVADTRLSTNVTLQGNTFNGANQLVQLNGTSQLPSVSGALLTNLNASNIASGTISDGRLSTNVALLGATPQAFTGANTFSNVSNSFTGSGAGLTTLNATNVSSGTLADTRLSANVTIQGNTFNGASQLVQTTAAGALPVLNAANLTSLNGSAIASGTINDARLSANVALLNATNSFTGTSNSFTNIINASGGIATGGAAINAGSGAITSGAINGQTISSAANFTGTLAVATLGAAGNTPICMNSSNQLGTCGTNAAVVTLQQAYNSSSNPEIVVDATRGALTVRDAATPIGANLLEVQNNAGTITYLGVTSSGIAVTGSATVSGNINTTSGQYQVNGAQISSANLSNDSNIAKLNGTGPQTFTGNNKFTGTVLNQNASDSTAAFQIQNAAGNSIFTADTTNKALTVGADLLLSNTISGGVGAASPDLTTGLIKFDNTYDASGNSTANKIIFYDDGSTFRSGIGISSGATNYFSGGSTNFYGNHISEASPGNLLFTLNGTSGATLNGQLSTNTGVNLSGTSSTGVITKEFIDGCGGSSLATRVVSLNSGGAVVPSTANDPHLIGVSLDNAPTCGTSTVRVAISGVVSVNAVGPINAGDQVVADGANGRVRADNNATVGIVGIAQGSLASGTQAAVKVVLNIKGGQSTPRFQNTANSTTAFQIQNAAGTSNLFSADTTNTRIGIGTAAPNYTLDVAGNVNASTQIYVNGVAVCTVNTCAAGSGTGNYIQNGTTAQTANFNVTGNGTVGGNLTGNGSALFQNATNSTTAFQIQNAAGNSNLLVADTTNSRVGIGKAPAQGALDVNGAIYGSSTLNITGQANTGNIVSTGSLVTNANNGAGIGFSTSSAITGNFTHGVNAAAPVNQYDVLVMNSGQQVQTSTIPRDSRVYGVAINTVASGYMVASTGGNYQVTADTGAVSIGDQLVVSATAGAVTVDNKATTGILGHATTSKAAGSNAVVGVNIRVVNGQYTPTFRNASDSPTAFQIQNAAGTSNLFSADTANTRIGIGTVAPNYTLDVAGNVNASTQIYVNGVAVCTVNSCAAGSGTGNYIQNGTTAQTANFNITGNGTVGGNLSVGSSYQIQGNTILQTPGVTSNANIALGLGALSSVTSGAHNNAVGGSALQSTTTGSFNTAMGDGALTANTSGSNNTAQGNASLASNTTGYLNTAQGDSSLVRNTTGFQNTAQGVAALVFNTTGANNAAFGYQAGLTGTAANANTTGSNNTFIGYNSGPGSTTQLQNASAIGTYSVVSQNDSLVLGCLSGVNGCTANTKVGIDNATPNYTLDVAGDINTTGAFRVNGTALSSSNLSNDSNLAKLNGTGPQTFTGNNKFTGTVVAQNATDSTTAFQIQNAGGTSVLAADTSNLAVSTGGDVTIGGSTSHAFYDGFESGNLNHWGYNSGLTVSSAVVRNGTKSANMTVTGGAGQYANTPSFSSTTVTFRSYVYIASYSTALDLMGIASTTNSIPAYVDTTGKLCTYFGGPICSTTTLPTGSWHKLEIRATVGTSGTAALYLDDVLAVSTTQNLGTTPFDHAYIGEGSSGRTGTVYYDDVSVDLPVAGGNSASLNVTDGLRVGGSTVLSGNTIVRPGTNSTAAFQIQNAAGTSNLFNADTTNGRIGIGTAAPNYTLDVAGNVNASTQIYVNGVAVCTVNTCAAGGGTGNYIQNGTTAQAANFNITGNGTVGGNLTGNGSALFQNGTNSTTAFQIRSAAAAQALLTANTSDLYVVNNGTTSPGNELQNPGFESNGTDQGTGWTVGGQKTIVNSSADAHGGNNELQIAANGASQDALTAKYYAVTPGDTIYFEGYMKNSAGANGTASIYAEFTDKDKTNAAYSGSGSVLPGTSYVLRTMTSTVPAGKYYLRIAANVAASATTGTFYFDDFYLKRSTEQAPPVFKNSADSTSAFQIQNAAGASNLFVADTANSKIGIGIAPTSGGTTLQVNNGLSTTSGGFTNSLNSYGLYFNKTGTNYIDANGSGGSLSFGSNGSDGQLVLSGINGSALFQDQFDSTNALKVVNHYNTATVLDVDTNNTRVGIGTAAPAYTLDVAGDINTTGSVLTSGITRIDSAGNLTNIGTVGLPGSASIILNTTTGGTLTVTSTNGVNNNLVIDDTGGGSYGTFQMKKAGTVVNQISAGSLSGATFFNAPNNFGIGTTTPQNNLEVRSKSNGVGSGGIRISASDAPTNGGYLVLNQSSSAGGAYGSIQSGDGSTFRVLSLNQNGGNVCIHLTTCNNALGISGTGAATGGFITSASPDIAETIPAAGDVQAYDVVTADPNGDTRAIRSAKAYDSTTIGVIADGSSSFRINSNAHENIDSLTGKYLVLAGRVPVHVTNEGGAIAPGDYLTTSSTPGYAMKATHAGPTIGKALAAFTGTSGTVMTQTNLSYYDPTAGSQMQGTAADFSSLNVSGATTLASLTVSGDATFNGNIMVNGHIVTGGASPTVIALAAAGAGSTVSIKGTDTAGVITVTAGTGPTAGDLATITFSRAFGAAPNVVISPASPNASTLQYYSDAANVTTALFKMSSNNAPAASTTYKYTYHVIQ